jgi:hypothetical protein
MAYLFLAQAERDEIEGGPSTRTLSSPTRARTPSSFSPAGAAWSKPSRWRPGRRSMRMTARLANSPAGWRGARTTTTSPVTTSPPGASGAEQVRRLLRHAGRGQGRRNAAGRQQRPLAGRRAVGSAVAVAAQARAGRPLLLEPGCDYRYRVRLRLRRQNGRPVPRGLATPEPEEKLHPPAEPLSPRPGDRLAGHAEPGQALADSPEAHTVRKGDDRHTSYLCLAGDFSEARRRIPELARDYLGDEAAGPLATRSASTGSTNRCPGSSCGGTPARGQSAPAPPGCTGDGLRCLAAERAEPPCPPGDRPKER